MPLPLSITGVPLHTRSLTSVASLREDGRWGVRGDVIDLRKCGFVPMTHDIQPSGIIHHMTIELVIDPANLRIESLETAQPHVAIEPSVRTGGECCRDPAQRLAVLKGETIDDAFAKRLSSTFGGPLGCSHLLTLFFSMAAALPRAIAHEAEILKAHDEPRLPGERLFWRSVFVDGYELDDESIELSVQLADVHSRPQHGVESPLDRLESHREARIVAGVAPPTFAVTKLRGAQRVRRMPNLGDARWDECSDALSSLVGSPVVPGLSRKARDLLQDNAELALVRDAMLQLAPGHIQVLAAITDRWFTRSREESSESQTGGAERKGGPPVGAIGGMIDSCYMWRTGSPLISARERVMHGRPEETDEKTVGDSADETDVEHA
jgi:hypothetical protein